MFTSPTLWWLAVCIGYQILLTGGDSKRKHPHSTQTLQCRTRQILYNTTQCRSGGQFFPWVRCYQLEAVKNHMCDPLRYCRDTAVCLSEEWDNGLWSPSTGYDECWIRIGNEERSWGKKIAQNGQGPQLFGNVAVQPISTCYTEVISRLQQAYNSCMIYCRCWRDHESVLVKHSKWRCGCIQIVWKTTWPPALSAKDLPGGWTQVQNARRITRIYCHPVGSDESSILESILDTEN